MVGVGALEITGISEKGDGGAAWCGEVRLRPCGGDEGQDGEVE